MALLLTVSFHVPCCVPSREREVQFGDRFILAVLDWRILVEALNDFSKYVL